MKKRYYKPILRCTHIALNTAIMSEGSGAFGDANDKVEEGGGWHVPARHLYI